MKKRIFLSAMAAAAIVTSGAQVNQQDGVGYLTRAELMLQDHNYNGCIDQLSQARRLSLSPEEEEQAAFMHAMASSALGQIDAMELLESYIKKYPVSANCVLAKMEVARLLYDDAQYANAWNIYRKIQPKNLDKAGQADYRTKRGYSALKIGDYDDALAQFNELGKNGEYLNLANFYKGYVAYAKEDYNEAIKLFKQVNKTEAPCNMADYYLAQIYFKQGNHDKALSTSRSLLRNADGMDADFVAEANRIAGESLYSLGQADQAVPYVKRYLENTENGVPSAYYIVGLNDYENGDYVAAIKNMSRVTEQKNAMGQSAYLIIGQSYLKEKNADAAIMAFTRAFELDFDKEVSETAYYNYAVAKTEGGRVPFGSSVSAFETFLQRYPKSKYGPRVQEYIINGYLTDNNYESALRSIERIANPSDATLKAKQHILYTLGCRDLSAGNIDGAVKRLSSAKALGDLNPAVVKECDLWIGEALYRQKKYDEAAKSYGAYLEGLPSTAENQGLARYNLGYSRFSMKEYGEAVTEFANFVKSPGNQGKEVVADARNRMGDCYYYASDFANAAKQYDASYSLAPENGDYALYQKALMNGLTGNHKEKVAGIKSMMSKFPTSGLIPSALLEMAESYGEMGQKGNVVETYRKVVKEYPTTTQGRQGALLLAISYMDQGNRDKGVESYKNVISSYPSSEEAKVAADDLKRIYADLGKLEDYAKFINSIPDAPRLEVGEMELLTFQAAEKDYLNSGEISRVEDYIKKYPQGKDVATALEYVATYYSETGNDDKALDYSSRLITDYPDSRGVENAMAIKGEIEYRQGKTEMALATFRALEKRASSPSKLAVARMGIARSSHAIGNHEDVVAAADQLLASSGVSEEQKDEAKFMRGHAYMILGKIDSAVKDWDKLSKETESLAGAKSAYFLGQLYFDQGNLKKSKRVVDAFVSSNTPHDYWLARGFILLSDITRKEGDSFGANEYLKTLKENYPGTEADILQMIESRLK